MGMIYDNPVNFFQSHSSYIATKRHHYMRILLLLLFLALLPLIVWAVMTQKTELRKYAANVPSPTSIPTPTITPSTAPIPVTGKEQPIEFRIKFDSVTGPEAEGATISVKFLLQNESTVQLSAPLRVTYLANGVYKATALLSNPLPAGSKFRVLLKGERHTAITFCKQIGQTTPCGNLEYINTPASLPASYVFDFTGIPLPPQANIDQLISLLSKPNSALTITDKIAGDLNYDDIVNGYDLILAQKTH
jgi:hypothetical protein